ncbi:MAG: hypothetical protein GYB68_04325, partial [Chloroflexi bacterium]|nr:hypothetical protein [Chloroflexota bacterium]
MDTPYSGKVGLWHTEGQALGEESIEELAETVRTWAPVTDAIWVKVAQGAQWQGASDRKIAFRIDGPEDISRWVNTLAGYDTVVYERSLPQDHPTIEHMQ